MFNLIGLLYLVKFAKINLLFQLLVCTLTCMHKPPSSQINPINHLFISSFHQISLWPIFRRYNIFQNHQIFIFQTKHHQVIILLYMASHNYDYFINYFYCQHIHARILSRGKGLKSYPYRFLILSRIFRSSSTPFLWFNTFLTCMTKFCLI